ncbi:MAG: zeta toxin family protein [Prevotella sp.]|nr:zeta toxin family protein [Prevotella sp.]
MADKHLYIISGPNGAGKTTASYTILPHILECREFVNADEIARGLSPFNPESVAIEAGRLMLSRIKELLAHNETFSIETTLATRSYFRLIENARRQGYDITLLYFWLNSPELAERRVAERVSKGGHNIPTDIIHRRYYEGIRNLFEIYVPIVDTWIIADNSSLPREVIATGGIGTEPIITNTEKLNYIKQYVTTRTSTNGSSNCSRS